MSSLKFSLKTEWFPLLIIAAAIVSSVYFYQHFPERVASHWSFSGQVNGYMGKTAAAVFPPALLCGIYALFLIIPSLDPKRQRYEEFPGVFRLFRNLIMAFLLALFIITGMYNTGFAINVGSVVPAMVGLLFVLLGNFMGKIKPNWFVGIRTPWTMSSENVWTKTHRFGGWAFVIFGLFLMLGWLLPQAVFTALFVAGIALVTVGSFAYSYILYRGEKRTDEQSPIL